MSLQVRNIDNVPIGPASADTSEGLRPKWNPPAMHRLCTGYAPAIHRLCTGHPETFFYDARRFWILIFSDPAQGPGPEPGPGARDQGPGPGPGTRARAQDPGPGPGPRAQGSGPGPRPRARALLGDGGTPTIFEVVPTPAHPAQGPKYVVWGNPSLGSILNFMDADLKQVKTNNCGVIEARSGMKPLQPYLNC